MVQLLHNIVVFVSGAVLMALEIVGSRVLAPYFGSSIFVWGSLISVVMAALSIGYYWGGWMSAREPSYGKLLTLLAIPGILIFFLPFLYPSVNEWIASHDFGTRLNPLIACSALFLLPGVFLGTISPYVIRLAATQAADGGQHRGHAVRHIDLRQHLRHSAHGVLLDSGARRQQYHSCFGDNAGVLVLSCSTLARGCSGFLWRGPSPRYRSSWVRSICGRRLLGRRRSCKKTLFIIASASKRTTRRATCTSIARCRAL